MCSRADAFEAQPPRVCCTLGSSRWTTRRRTGAVTRRARQARRLVGVRGADGAIDDLLVAQRGAAEHRVVGVDQPLVAAPVDRERRARVGRLGGVEVGVDVGAAERVDRLLRVADQHQRRAAAAERAAQDVPLHGVGVLELVHEHDAIALSQPRGGRRAAGTLERLVEPREQVVVAHHRQLALAPLELLADRVARAGGASRRCCPRAPSAARSAPPRWRPRAVRSPAPGRDRSPGCRARGSGARRGRRRPRRAGPRRSRRRPCRAARRRRRRARRAPPGRTRGSWRSSPRRSRRGRARAAPGATRSARACPARAAARPRRERRPARPPGRRPRPCSAETSRSRTRSRSSPVAMRVNVTSSSCDSGVPSAT